MCWIDRGDWSRAEEEEQDICSRPYAAETYRFPALITLARLRIRRGDQDADTPFEAARRLSAAMGEPQRAVYIAMLAAERAWLPNEAAPAADEAKSLLREVHATAEQRHSHWVAEDSALWLYMLGEPVAATANLATPYREHCEGRWGHTAAGWRALRRPYD